MTTSQVPRGDKISSRTWLMGLKVANPRMEYWFWAFRSNYILSAFPLKKRNPSNILCDREVEAGREKIEKSVKGGEKAVWGHGSLLNWRCGVAPSVWKCKRWRRGWIRRKSVWSQDFQQRHSAAKEYKRKWMLGVSQLWGSVCALIPFCGYLLQSGLLFSESLYYLSSMCTKLPLKSAKFC